MSKKVTAREAADTAHELFWFDVQVYGRHAPSPSHSSPGVMSAYRMQGSTAQEVADKEAKRWEWHGQAGSVGVVSADRTRGFANAKVKS